MPELSPRAAIDAINQRFGRHRGFRALHAKGQFLKGTFTASPAVASLCLAAHLQGSTVEVTARFSNGGGDPGVPDFQPDVRGLAVSFHLPDGKRTDIVAQTAPRFPVRTPEAFIDFVKAMEPGLKQLWRLPAFLLKHPESLAALKASAGALIKPPASYGSVPYYAVHAFEWTAADGSKRHVRYLWIPEKPATLSLSAAKARGPDYLQKELQTHLQQEPIRLSLVVQVAAPGDEVDDPLAAWPEDREQVIVGQLELTALEPSREVPVKPFVFDPLRLTDGIGASNDPVLQYRPRAYSESVERRQG